MAKPPVGIQAVAEAAGVSTTTVHRALNGLRRVSPATRQRVQEVARRLGYHPNHLARSLRTRRTATFGVVFGSMGVSFFAELLTAVESAAREAGYALLFACAAASPEKERASVDLMLEKAVEGIIVAPTHPFANRAYYVRLRERGCPFVWVDCSIERLRADLVATDHERGGYLAGQALAQAGCRQVAVVNFPPPMDLLTSAQGRVRGCAAALAEAGLPPPRELTLPLGSAASIEEYGYLALRDYLAAGGALDGLFAVQDALAYGALAAADEERLTVPADFSLVGFDDMEFSRYTHPPLTSLRQPVEQMGSEAVRLLLRRLEGDYTALPPERVLLEPQLVLRQSCPAASPAGERQATGDS